MLYCVRGGSVSNGVVDALQAKGLNARFIEGGIEGWKAAGGAVMRIAEATGAIPYDVPGVELGHQGDRCSFDAFIAQYRLEDKALHKLALIVRSADCNAHHLAPEAKGLLAISKGLSLNFTDDHEMLKQGMVVYDALYAWCADTPLKMLGRWIGVVR